MLHVMKLAVGVRDVGHLRALHQARAEATPPLRHFTRNAPRRAGEIVDGGSLYWVIGGMLLVRQPILRIAPDRWDDGSACTAFWLDPALVALVPRPVKPFQGWRYLAPEAAPADLTSRADAEGEEALPPALRQALQALCLL
jgi:hypothetical protein